MDLARGGIIRELSSYFKADKLSPDALFIPHGAAAAYVAPQYVELGLYVPRPGTGEQKPV